MTTMGTDNTERAELLEAVIDNLATDLIPKLNRIADKATPPAPPKHPTCANPKCRRPYNAKLWLAVLTQAGDTKTIELKLCNTHALEAHRAHAEGRLPKYGDADILKTFIKQWQGAQP